MEDAEIVGESANGHSQEGESRNRKILVRSQTCVANPPTETLTKMNTRERQTRTSSLRFVRRLPQRPSWLDRNPPTHLRKCPTLSVRILAERILMAEPSREEIAAKLEAAEARTEARFAQLTGTLDVRFANLDTKIDRLVNSVGQLSAVVDEAKKEGRADNKTTRWTIIVVVVASVLAGLAALWTTQANLLAAFQAGLAVKTLQSGPPKP